MPNYKLQIANCKVQIAKCKCFSLSGLSLLIFAQAATAQGTTIFGRVVSDSGMILVGAEVVLNGPQNLQRTNEKGEFAFARVAPGFQIIGVRMPGYAPKVDTIEVEDAGEIRREYRLTRIETTLPEVPVRTTPLDRKLVEFAERRRTLGTGRFLDSAEFANSRGTKTSDRIARLPGVLIQRGRGNEVFITNTRQRRSGDPGSRSFCRSLVWLDGVNMGIEYNVNELDPTIIAAVEWYASNQNAPAKLVAPPRFSARGTTEPYCGILVIWLR